MQPNFYISLGWELDFLILITEGTWVSKCLFSWTLVLTFKTTEEHATDKYRTCQRMHENSCRFTHRKILFLTHTVNVYFTIPWE